MIKLFVANSKYPEVKVGTLPCFNPDLPADFLKSYVTVSCTIDGVTQYLRIGADSVRDRKDWKPSLTRVLHEQDLSKYDVHFLFTALHRACSFLRADLILTSIKTGAQAAVTPDCWIHYGREL